MLWLYWFQPLFRIAYIPSTSALLSLLHTFTNPVSGHQTRQFFLHRPAASVHLDTNPKHPSHQTLSPVPPLSLPSWVWSCRCTTPSYAYKLTLLVLTRKKLPNGTPYPAKHSRPSQAPRPITAVVNYRKRKRKIHFFSPSPSTVLPLAARAQDSISNRLALSSLRRAQKRRGKLCPWLGNCKTATCSVPGDDLLFVSPLLSAASRENFFKFLPNSLCTGPACSTRPARPGHNTRKKEASESFLFGPSPAPVSLCAPYQAKSYLCP